MVSHMGLSEKVIPILQVYQAKHECHYVWTITSQYGLVHRISYIDSLGQFNYGLAHASSNHVILKFVKKMGKSNGNHRNSCKQSNSCFKAIAWFYNVCNLQLKN